MSCQELKADSFRLLELRCRIAGVVREICVQIARKLCRFGVGSLGAEFFGSSVSFEAREAHGCEHAGVALALMACLLAGVNCDARLGVGEFERKVVEVGVPTWASKLWFGCSCFAPVRWQLRR